jgi:hypothetical protein
MDLAELRALALDKALECQKDNGALSRKALLQGPR